MQGHGAGYTEMAVDKPVDPLTAAGNVSMQGIPYDRLGELLLR